MRLRRMFSVNSYWVSIFGKISSTNPSEFARDSRLAQVAALSSKQACHAKMHGMLKKKPNPGFSDVGPCEQARKIN